MQTKNSDFSLDASANELYAQLSGIDTTRRILDPAPRESSLLDLLGAEEQWLDRNRLILIEICWLLADILHKNRHPSPGHGDDQENALWLAIKQLSTYPRFDGTISIRYRGSGFPGQDAVQEQCDYEVSTGNLLLDLQVAGSMAKRMAGRPGSAMPNQLLAAFKGFSALGINHFYLDCKVCSEEDRTRLLNSLRALTRYYREAGEPGNSTALVFDEYNLPNPNLTLLATINKVNPASIQKLVREITPMLFGPEPKEALAAFPTVFNAIFAFPKLNAQLNKPPIEVNNIQRLMPGQTGAAENRNQALLSRMAIANYGTNPRQVAEVLASVSSGGYQNIYMGTLQKRLTLATDFLNKSETAPQSGKVRAEALHNIETGLEMVPDELYEAMDIFGQNQDTTKTGQISSHNGPLHEEISSLLSFFTRRSVIKKKMRDMVRGQVKFEAQDYAVIARNFKITDAQAAHLVQLLNGCFDQNGRFRRSAFEKSIPEFVQYETKVFEFLWHYLKELVSRDDRVSFLNAMQHLIAKLDRPSEALKILLGDIFGQPHRVGFSDRNGLLLANILIRTYNQELGNHIELTPEEVLQVKMGLDQDMLGQALAFLEETQEQLFRKLRTIHEELQKTLTREANDANIPLRYLITLERELIIFLALVGGPISHKIIHGVVKEYGNPDSGMYASLKSPEECKSFLQLLQVAVRGLKRFSGMEDLLLCTILTDQEPRFLALWDNDSHVALVKRVMEWAR
ncbi:MAG: hypothetical protein KKH22_05550 [Proteobacteria bacterium]|nr:hypothetical protein [Pseudomonadota bacterium]